MIAIMKLIWCLMVLAMLRILLAVSPSDGTNVRHLGSTCSIDGDDGQEVQPARSNNGGYSFSRRGPVAR